MCSLGILIDLALRPDGLQIASLLSIQQWAELGWGMGRIVFFLLLSFTVISYADPVVHTELPQGGDQQGGGRQGAGIQQRPVEYLNPDDKATIEALQRRVGLVLKKRGKEDPNKLSLEKVSVGRCVKTYSSPWRTKVYLTSAFLLFRKDPGGIFEAVMKHFRTDKTKATPTQIERYKEHHMGPIEADGDKFVRADSAMHFGCNYKDNDLRVFDCDFAVGTLLRPDPRDPSKKIASYVFRKEWSQATEREGSGFVAGYNTHVKIECYPN
jgi:hypothetical protein